MPSIVITEIKASIIRHRLFDRLADRTDIIKPQDLAPGLARRIPKFIVAGLDDSREPGTGGWPIPTGGRYTKLCFSPGFDGGSDDDAHHSYRLPLTQYNYVGYVQATTGLGANEANDLGRIYRFDTAEIFDACREMRTSCPPAWRLLLSNEFALALRLWPSLGDPPPRSQFHYPLIDAFRVIAEFERAGLMMRHLARARAILDRPKFLEALGSPLPLSGWYKPGELVEVYRWIEYAMFSSAALTDLLFNRDPAGVLALPKGYAPWAIARGEMIGAAADFKDDPEVRKAVAHVFSRPPLVDPKAVSDANASGRKPPVERRKGILRNDEVLRWYGMTNEVLPIIALDGARDRYPTRRARNAIGAARRAQVRDNSRPVLARLGSAMRKHTDPAMQRAIEQASAKYMQDSILAADRAVSLEANTKLGLKLALTHLPPTDRLGGAARFDPRAWEGPLRDAELWEMLIDLQRGGKAHMRAHPARRQLRTSIGILRRTYSPFFAGLQWTRDVERVVCDLACALSPISVDPHIAFAIHMLGQKPRLRVRLSRQLQRRGYGRR